MFSAVTAPYLRSDDARALRYEAQPDILALKGHPRQKGSDFNACL